MLKKIKEILNFFIPDGLKYSCLDCNDTGQMLPKTGMIGHCGCEVGQEQLKERMRVARGRIERMIAAAAKHLPDPTTHKGDSTTVDIGPGMCLEFQRVKKADGSWGWAMYNGSGGYVFTGESDE